jgi:hypothetical protein
MTRSKMSFSKEFVSANPFYNYKNTVRYNILEENLTKSTLTVYSTLTAELQTEGRKYSIKPTTFARFFVTGLEILSETSKIGRGTSSKVTINKGGIDEVWMFHAKGRWFGSRRSNPYTTKLKCGDKEIDYVIEMGDFFSASNKNECLRNVNGTASFSNDDRLPSYLGIYLNELLIFNDMDK